MSPDGHCSFKSGFTTVEAVGGGLLGAEGTALRRITAQFQPANGRNRVIVHRAKGVS